MPTRPTKGDHGHADRGSREGTQGEHVTGSSLDPDVARARREAEGIEPDSPAGDASAQPGPAGGPGSTSA